MTNVIELKPGIYRKGEAGFIEPGSELHNVTVSPSKVAAILGVSRWESEYRLWHRMRGITPPEPDKDDFRVGHAFEPTLAYLWKHDPRIDNSKWQLSPGEVQFVGDASRFGFPYVVTLDRRARSGKARRIVEFKALACSTPILTTSGWSTMGDLHVGAEVYAPDGQATKVTGVQPIQFGRPCYRITFRDGQEITSDADHLWQVWDAAKRCDRVLTTQQIISSGLRPIGKNQWRFHVPVAQCLDLDEKPLTVDPYVLGYWLGDGTASKSEIACGERDLPNLCAALYGAGFAYQIDRTGSCPMVKVQGLRTALAAAGIKSGKFIPDDYLHGSESQRRALLAGILDSDGTVTEHGHQVSVGMIQGPLMSSVLQLVRSLGYRAALRTHTARLNGEEKGTVYTVRFSTRHAVNPFHMTRKRAIYDTCFNRERPRAQDISRNAIVGIEPVESVPVRCITVAHESALYVAGVGFAVTHNTTRGFEEWGDEFTDEAPPDYVCQVTAQMLLTGFTKEPAHLVVLNRFGCAHHVYVIEYSESVADFIVSRCREFYDSLSLETAPPLDDSVATYECVREQHPDIDKGAEVEIPVELALEYHEAWAADEAATKRLRFAKTQVLDTIGRANFAVAAGERVARRQSAARGAISLNRIKPGSKAALAGTQSDRDDQGEVA